MPQGVLDGGIDLGHTAGLDAKSTGKDVGSSGSSGCSCNMSPAPQRYLGFLLVGMAVLARRIRRGRRQP
jgi:MYXO-CTERM domain-containing protein